MGLGDRNTRVCIVDDHEIVRDGVRWLLEAAGGFEVVGEAGDGRHGLETVLETRPDVALIDTKLPGSDGISLVRSIRSRDPEILCLVLTSYPGREVLRDAVLAGASGLVSKDVSGQRLIDDITKVAAGGSVLDWNVVEFDHVLARPEPGPADLVDALTEQERRILELLAEGRTNHEIAEALFLSEKTVRNYVSTLLGKLGVRNRTQAATLLVTLRSQSRARSA